MAGRMPDGARLRPPDTRGQRESRTESSVSSLAEQMRRLLSAQPLLINSDVHFAASGFNGFLFAVLLSQ
ncbi:hypothetical protein CesoFtcFv8_025281 [Champsocephalus esox]|uniref:Uncharacterized protein n=1 Tax=Champsocephalus esox TaxID=159716 RepID=A0AAN8GC99_9TELE|nr:hypothetical protein CesoFtcFv8_025281 [Champsocephalus esox]